MRIVKFKNGKYGVRKWSLGLMDFGWVFAVDLPDAAWMGKSARYPQEFETIEDAKRVMEKMEKKALMEADKGRIV